MRTPRVRALSVAALGAALAVGYLAGRARAQGAPQSTPLYYSGTLEENGNRVDGARDITLALWTDATATDMAHRACTTTAPGTAVTAGSFRVVLADACVAAVRANADLWIETIVAGTSFGRAKLGAVPYALEADHATRATTATGLTPGAQVSVGALSVGGNPSSGHVQFGANGATFSAIKSFTVSWDSPVNTGGITFFDAVLPEDGVVLGTHLPSPGLPCGGYGCYFTAGGIGLSSGGNNSNGTSSRPAGGAPPWVRLFFINATGAAADPPPASFTIYYLVP